MGTPRLHHARRRIVVGALIAALLWWPVAAFPQTPTKVTIHLAWDANTETDLAGYIVVWGFASRLYTQSFESTLNTATIFVDMLPGQTVYMSVRAVNLAGLQSGFSNEVTWSLDGTSPAQVTITRVPPAD